MHFSYGLLKRQFVSANVEFGHEHPVDSNREVTLEVKVDLETVSDDDRPVGLSLTGQIHRSLGSGFESGSPDSSSDDSDKSNDDESNSGELAAVAGEVSCDTVHETVSRHGTGTVTPRPGVPACRCIQ